MLEQRIAIAFPGQEKLAESDDPTAPEQSLLTRILAPYDGLVQRLDNLKNIVGFGNSFGFFAALVAAGAIYRKDALYLVGERGSIVRTTEDCFAKEEMEAKARDENTTQLGRTGMLRLIAVPIERRERLQKNYQLNLSNDYGPIVVLTGRVNALKGAMNETDRATLLPIDAYHDPIRKKDSLEFAKVVEGTRIVEAQFPVISSTDPRPRQHPDDIREELVGMMIRPVVLKDILLAFQKEGIGIAFDLDQSASFKKLAGALDEAKGRLRLLSNSKEAEQFFSLFSDSGHLIPGAIST